MEKELKKKNWPVWVKILGIISILIIISIVVWLTIIFPTTHMASAEGGPLAFMWASWYFLSLIGMWGLGFLTRYLIKKKLYWIANTILIIGLILFSMLFLILSSSAVRYLFKSNFLGFIILFTWLIVIAVFFIISLILINKAKKMEKTILEKKPQTPFKRGIVWGIIGLIFVVLFYSSIGKYIFYYVTSFSASSKSSLLILTFLVFGVIGFIIGKIKSRKQTK